MGRGDSVGGRLDGVDRLWFAEYRAFGSVFRAEYVQSTEYMLYYSSGLIPACLAQIGICSCARQNDGTPEPTWHPAFALPGYLVFTPPAFPLSA